MDKNMNKHTEQSSQASSSYQQPTFTTATSAVAEEQVTISMKAKVLWFLSGLASGVFGMAAAWIFTGSWGKGYREQAVWAAWAGFAVQVVVTLMLYGAGYFPGAETATVASSVTGATSIAFG